MLLAVMRRSSATWSASAVLSAMVFAYLHCCGGNLTVGVCTAGFQASIQSLICCSSRSSFVVQLVQVSQVSDCSYLQQSEIVFAGITKIGDVAMEGRTPVIVLADAAVAQQVTAPSECTRSLYGPRSHRHLPIFP